MCYLLEAAPPAQPDDQGTPPKKNFFPQNAGNPAGPENGNTLPKEEVSPLMQSHQMERAENVIYVTILNDGETRAYLLFKFHVDTGQCNGLYT